MHIKALGIVLALTSISAIASDMEWVPLSTSSAASYEAKFGSWRLDKNRAGKPISLIVGRVKSRTEDSVTFETWHVTVEDCERGMGKIYTLTVGGVYKFDNDFVLDGGSIASGIASTLCDIAKASSKPR